MVKMFRRSTPINKILVGGNGQSKDPERNLLKPNFELEWQDQKTNGLCCRKRCSFGCTL